MSTSSERKTRWTLGFSLVELLVALSLTVCVALAVAPVWLSLERQTVRAADNTVGLLQARVAIARFERDLRLAGASGSPFAVEGPVLQASLSHVVFLERDDDGETPSLVEWEIASGALMRRWGPCPATRPVTFPHSLYVDSKTMLEGVGPSSELAYSVDGRMLPAPVVPDELQSVDGVSLRIALSKEATAASVVAQAWARVGR